MYLIEITPLSSGWSVMAHGLAANQMIFRSGRIAEITARSLARKLTEAGSLVQLRLRLRGEDISTDVPFDLSRAPAWLA
jgi:hypothetical protein